VALLGLFVPPLRLLYDYAWFVGFGVSGAVYVLLMQRVALPARVPEWEGEG
jgi:NCS1 family nucleobase:cation symporter-1